MCTYCDDTANTRDHVIPVSFNRPSRSNNTPIRDTVLCCKECNSLLGARSLYTVSERAGYLYEALSKRYKKLLGMPDWSDEELSGLGEDMKQIILRGLSERERIRRRLSHLLEVAVQ